MDQSDNRFYRESPPSPSARHVGEISRSDDARLLRDGYTVQIELTGSRGAGKTTIANTILAPALRMAGYTVVIGDVNGGTRLYVKRSA